jgi:hypothetical protein
MPGNRHSPERADAFTRSFLRFSHGRSSPTTSTRPVTVTCLYPYGREMTGYEVNDLQGTLTKARNSGAVVLVEPYTSGGRSAAMVQFPGGYIAEIHATAPDSKWESRWQSPRHRLSCGRSKR